MSPTANQPGCGDAICARTLALLRDGIPCGELTLEICAPLAFPDGRGHYCCYRILGPDIALTRWAAGADSLQALQLAVRTLPVEVGFLCQKHGFSAHLAGARHDMGFKEAPLA